MWRKSGFSSSSCCWKANGVQKSQQWLDTVLGTCVAIPAGEDFFGAEDPFASTGPMFAQAEALVETGKSAKPAKAAKPPKQLKLRREERPNPVNLRQKRRLPIRSSWRSPPTAAGLRL